MKHHPDIEKYWLETFGEVFRTNNYRVMEGINRRTFCAQRYGEFISELPDWYSPITEGWLIVSSVPSNTDWVYWLLATSKWYDEESMVRLLRLRAFL